MKDLLRQFHFRHYCESLHVTADCMETFQCFARQPAYLGIDLKGSIPMLLVFIRVSSSRQNLNPGIPGQFVVTSSSILDTNMIKDYGKFLPRLQ